jgi:hypothetical protein
MPKPVVEEYVESCAAVPEQPFGCVNCGARCAMHADAAVLGHSAPDRIGVNPKVKWLPMTVTIGGQYGAMPPDSGPVIV